METEAEKIYGEELIVENYQETLWIKEYEEGIHGSLMNSLKEMDEERLTEIFGIKNPNRVLSEGYRIQDDIMVEDFAITGSYDGGEIAVGQIVSSNGKEPIGSVPKDFIQARSFADRLDRYPGIEIGPEGLYVIRTGYSSSEVEKRNRNLEKDLDLFGRAMIPVDIFEVKPIEPEGDIEQFYSSLAHS